MAPEALCIRAVYPRVHIHMYGTCKCMLTWMRAFGQRHYPAGLLSTFSFYRLGLCAFLHPHQCNGDTWTKLVPMGNAEARWWLLRNKWHHCRAKIILFTYVRHFFVKIKCLRFSRNACIFTFHYTPRLRSHHSLKLNFISKIWNFTMQIITKSIIACQCVSRRHKK